MNTQKIIDFLKQRLDCVAIEYHYLDEDQDRCTNTLLANSSHFEIIAEGDYREKDNEQKVKFRLLSPVTHHFEPEEHPRLIVGDIDLIVSPVFDTDNKIQTVVAMRSGIALTAQESKFNYFAFSKVDVLLFSPEIDQTYFSNQNVRENSFLEELRKVELRREESRTKFVKNLLNYFRTATEEQVLNSGFFEYIISSTRDQLKPFVFETEKFKVEEESLVFNLASYIGTSFAVHGLIKSQAFEKALNMHPIVGTEEEKVKALKSFFSEVLKQKREAS